MWQRWNQSSHIFEKSTDNGGSWTPLGLSASIITEGSLADARLSANVPLTNKANTFTGAQGLVTSDARWIFTQDNARFNYLQATNYGFDLMNNVYYDTGGSPILSRSGVPSWIFRMGHNDSVALFRAPAGSLGHNSIFSVNNAGGLGCAGPIYERARSYAMGQRTSWTPTLYTAEGSGCGGTMNCWYAVAGDILFWSVYIVNFNNPGAGTGYLRFTMPPGFPPVAADVESSIVRIYVPGIGDNTGFTQNNASGGYPGFVHIYRIPIVGWPAGLGHIIGQGRYFIG